MRRCVIACKTVEAELRAILPPDIEFRSLDQGLHRTPERLRESLQQEIDSIDADEILLGYGLCGNGLAGLSSSGARLVVPRVDDCIAILLGSFDRYQHEFHKEPGTYWFSYGWIELAENDPYKEYKRCVLKYGEETARWVAGEMMKGYQRVALIDTGVYPVAQIRGYAMEFATFFGLRYEEMDGGEALVRDLLSSETRDGKFVVVEPGEKITADMFQPPLGTINA
jgi:hypothetical protein